MKKREGYDDDDDDKNDLDVSVLPFSTVIHTNRERVGHREGIKGEFKALPKLCLLPFHCV